MSAPDKVANLLASVSELAGRSEWMLAADSCGRQLEQLNRGQNLLLKAEVAEFAGRCYFRGAFQARSNQEFQHRMRLSHLSYAKATGFYEREHQEPLSRRATAQGLFSKYWVELETRQRRITIEECVKLAGEVSSMLEGLKEERRLAETHLGLQNYLRESFYLAKSRDEVQNYFAEAVRIGRINTAEFERLGDENGLFESLCLTLWMMVVEGEPILTPSDFQAMAAETKELLKKLQDISEKLGNDHTRSIARMMSGYMASTYEGEFQKALVLLKDALAAAQSVHDSLTVGLTSWQASHITLWTGNSRDLTEERRKALDEAEQLGSICVKNLEISRPTSFLAAAYANQANISIGLGSLEADRGKRGAYFRKAIAQASMGVECEDHTWSWKLAAHTLAKAMYFLAVSGVKPDEKTRLLSDAKSIREEHRKVSEVLLPTSAWDKCTDLNYLALVKRELSSTETDPDKRVRLLEEAASDMRQCLEMGRKWGASGNYFRLNLASYSEWYGDTLARLHLLTGKKDHAEVAVQAYRDAIEYLVVSKHELPLAPIRGKVARVCDAIGDYASSSQGFTEASEDYILGARRFPEMAITFEELSKYMASWAKVETARLHHAQEEYMSASEKYEEASRILSETKEWNYLTKFGMARSILEKGEALNQLEKHASSVRLFADSASLFKEARNDVESRLKDSSSSLENDELRYWLSIADGREKYCQGRVLLEEAQALDKKGEKSNSSKKYRTAAGKFAQLAHDTRNPQERVEFETLEKFCEALGSMKEGEAKASPKLFSEAADLFMRAKETASGDRFRLLALANAYICKALDAGTRFRLSRETLLYGEVKKHLETAADYYQEAGFRKAAGWTRATQRLFDSLFCLTAAETEMDRRKKADYYDQAEKHLESAAKLYGEAGFPGKKLEAVEHLQRAREAKDILSSSIETLAEMPTASGAVLTPLSLTSSQAVGLERFEEANVVGNLRVSNREIVLGSEFEFEVDLANVGRTAATLVKIESLLPLGFELPKEKNPYRWEDHSIDLGGRRLDYLKSFKVKIILHAAKAGVFELRPKVSFADEKGNYRFYQSWGETITVQEPLVAVKKSMALQRVPPVIRIPAEFRFATERSRVIFEYLVKEFLEDYMTKRLYVEKAGWRSLMDLSRGLKLPRSAVYAPQGRSTTALSELERRGLVEARIFPEERGRGGDITRVRVAYENLIVKRLLDQLVMGNQ